MYAMFHGVSDVSTVLWCSSFSVAFGSLVDLHPCQCIHPRCMTKVCITLCRWHCSEQRLYKLATLALSSQSEVMYCKAQQQQQTIALQLHADFILKL